MLKDISKTTTDIQEYGTKDILSDSGQQLASSPLFTAPLEDMNTDEVHFGWSMLDLMEKAIKPRKEDMRVRLLKEAEEYGLEDPNGSVVLPLGDGEIKKEKRQGKDVVKEADLRDLLITKGVDPNRCFVSRTVYEFDPVAFKQLLADGLITEEEVKGCFTSGKVTWALKVKKPNSLPRSLKA